MKKIIDLAINKPKKIMLIALLLLIPTLLGYIFTGVNYDILTYLPGRLDSVQGEKILSETYNISSTTMVIVENMSPKKTVALKNKISQVKNVSTVLWADDILDSSVPADILPDSIHDVFYSNDGSYTMMFVLFDRDCSSKDELNAVKDIEKVTKKECLLSGLTPISADTRELTGKELPIYITLGVILALLIMFFTTDAYLLPLILVGVLGISVVYNMGTNFVFGSISYITQCIAAILQLGVTMDYSIFLVNRYNEEKQRYSENTVAMRRAIESSMTSLKGSSLTTVFGFLALCFMQLSLGFNIGMVMAKGVVIGVMSVLIILPAFLLVFDKNISKRKHKVFSPDFSKIVDFSLKHKKVLSTVFIVLLIPAIILAANVNKYYNLTSTLPPELGSVKALDTLKNEFNMTTSHFIVVDDSLPAEKLLDMETKLQNVDGIDSLIAYNLYLGTSIPDSIVPDEVTQLIKQGGYQIMLANSIYDAATDESNAQVKEMTHIIKSCDPDGYITGEGAMYNDLIGVTNIDFTVTSIISIVAIFVLIAILFKSISIPAILIVSIELAILINESISTIFGTPISFVSPTVISCVQLGATVDYAILLTSRFKEELSAGYDKFTAIKRAAAQSMRSIFQSASIFFVVTFGVYLVSSIEIVREICALLARGSIISALVILFMLTPVLCLSENFIARTSKGWRTAKAASVENISEPEEKIEEFSYDFNMTDETSYTEFTFDDEQEEENE